MKIILEGNECTGKSTVAQKLSEKLGFEIIKGSSFELSTGTNESLYNSFINLLKMENVIIDRMIWSNMVYATLFPEYTILTREQFEEIDTYMHEHDNDNIVLYLYTNTDTLKERIKARGDEYINEDKLESINEMYEYYWMLSQKEPFGLDTSLLSSDEIVDFVMNVIAK
jgi:thymidylate kinase